jgi:hypothetical protein
MTQFKPPPTEMAKQSYDYFVGPGPSSSPSRSNLIKKTNRYLDKDPELNQFTAVGM